MKRCYCARNACAWKKNRPSRVLTLFMCSRIFRKNAQQRHDTWHSSSAASYSPLDLEHMRSLSAKRSEEGIARLGVTRCPVRREQTKQANNAPDAVNAGWWSYIECDHKFSVIWLIIHFKKLHVCGPNTRICSRAPPQTTKGKFKKKRCGLIFVKFELYFVNLLFDNLFNGASNIKIGHNHKNHVCGPNVNVYCGAPPQLT